VCGVNKYCTMKVVNRVCEFEYGVSSSIAERRNLKVMILFASSKCLAPDFGMAYLIARAWQKPKWQKEFSGRRWTDTYLTHDTDASLTACPFHLLDAPFLYATTSNEKC